MIVCFLIEKNIDSWLKVVLDSWRQVAKDKVE
jgi:hypothetical protein